MLRIYARIVLFTTLLFLAACGARGPAPAPATPTRPASLTAAPKAQAPPTTAVASGPPAAPNAALPAHPAPTRGGGEAKAAVQPTATPVPPALRPPPTDSAVKLFVLPDDGYTPVINAINSAQKSIRLVIYLLLDDDVVDALIAARKRGVEVRVMVEPEPMGGGGSQADINKLKAGSVFVKDSPQTFRFTHQKTLIVDDRLALIMTLNLTYSSFTRNREYGVIDTQPERVAEIARVFDADWQRESVQVGHPDLVWSPNNARTRLLQYLRSAQSSVDIQIEGLSDNEIEDALGALAGRGVRVRVLLPTLEAGDSRLGELDRIVRRGVRLRRLDAPFQHMKMVVIDGRRAWVGSQNFSANALDNNRELGIFITDAASLGRLMETFETDWNKGS